MVFFFSQIGMQKMSTGSASLTISIIAVCISVASFLGAVWRLWRDRPRLNFYVGKAISYFKQENEGVVYLQIRASNIGYRPIILTDFFAVAELGSFHMGIHDELAAVYGIEDQCFPAIVEPGKTLTIHPMTLSAFERNLSKPQSKKECFDHYKYFFFRDSFGHVYYVDIEWIQRHFGMLQTIKPDTWWQKVCKIYERKRLLHKMKRRNRLWD